MNSLAYETQTKIEKLYSVFAACSGRSTLTRWCCGFGYQPIFWSQGLSILRQPTKLVTEGTLLVACFSKDTLLKRLPLILQQDVKCYAARMSDAKATIVSLVRIFASWTTGLKKPGLKTSKTIHGDSTWRADLVEVWRYYHTSRGFYKQNLKSLCLHSTWIVERFLNLHSKKYEFLILTAELRAQWKPAPVEHQRHKKNP